MDAEPEEDDGSRVTAALGNTWSHAVNTRLIVQYLDETFRQVKFNIYSTLNKITQLRLDQRITIWSQIARYRVPIKLL